MKKLLIWGIGIWAETMYAYFKRNAEYQICAFIVDDEFKDERTMLFDLSIIASSDFFRTYSPNDYEIFVAIGYKNMNTLRDTKIRELRTRGYKMASYIDSSAQIDSTVVYGDNCVILDHTVVQPFAKIGHGVIILSGVNIGHHSIINDNVFISISATVLGCAYIGNNSFIGGNATIRDSCEVADFTLVGAAAYIDRNTKSYGVYNAPKGQNIINEEIMNFKEQCRFI